MEVNLVERMIAFRDSQDIDIWTLMNVIVYKI